MPLALAYQSAHTPKITRFKMTRFYNPTNTNLS